MGSIINLYFPKFDFVNEIEVVKQSIAALISIFGSFGIIVMNGLLYYGFSTVMGMELSLLLVCAFNTLIAYLFYLWMVRVTAKRFLHFAV
jgi:ABC-2 type transport system permease protein